jgi:hypothetical protein
MAIAVPKISKSSKKFKRPCWWNPEVGEKKHALNKSQRTFKLKSSPINLSSLIKTSIALLFSSKIIVLSG